MKASRLGSTFGTTTGVLALLLISPFTASSQTPPGGREGIAAAPYSGDLRELQDQIRDLSSALREMREEMQVARKDATELRQELKQTSDQLLAVKLKLAGTPDEARTLAPPVAAPQHLSATSQQLDARVSTLEDEQQMLGAKVDDHYQTKVESGSKYRVRLSGMALFNAFSTRGATDTFDVPTTAQARDPRQPNAGFGATLRQSIIGLDVFGPIVGGAKTTANLQMDFSGGFPITWDGVTAGLMRLRTAGLRLDWQDTSIVAGQYAPLISPLSPASLTSVAYPALSSSGNLWTWTPQIYVEHRIGLSPGSRMLLQGGIMDPLTGEFPQDSYLRASQAGERTGRPAYAGRVAWSRNSEYGPITVGGGGYFAQQNWGFGRMVNAWAGTADWDIPLSHQFKISGEFYRGQGIGGLGAAGGQSVALTGALDNPDSIIRGLNSTGGWAQLKFMPNEKLEFNGVFGEDFSTSPELPNNPGIGYVDNSIGRNASLLFNSIYHLRSNLLFSVEYNRLRTSQGMPGLFRANQVSLSAATLF
jgi:hypothetical protein